MGNPSLMCEHIVLSNPEDAISVCNSYGYSVDESDAQQVSDTLHEIIANGEEQDLRNVLDIHPDKDIILAMYSSKRCNAYPIGRRNYSRFQSFYGIGGTAGTTSTEWGGGSKMKDNDGLFSNMISMQTNNILILGLVLVGGALLYNTIKK